MVAAADSTPNPFARTDTVTPAARRVLRFVAVAGVGVVLVQETISAFPLEPRQAYGLIVLALVVPAVLFTLVVGTRSAWQKIRGYPDLLVPLGLLTLAEAVVGWLTLLPATAAVLTPSKQLSLAAVSFTLSLSGLVVIALNIAYAAWTTVLIRNVILEQRADAAGAVAACWRWFLRVLGLEVLGWGVLFAGLAVAVAIAPVAMVLALPAIGIGALVWNLATAALLPVALDERLGFVDGLKTGLAASWANKGRWWKLVVVQMLLLGWLIFVHASYSESTPRGYTQHNETNWAVNAFWTGGYENSCRWYSAVAKAYKTPKAEVIATVLGLFFAVLAIAAKLTVAERLWPPQPPVGDQGPVAEPEAPVTTEPPDVDARYTADG
jgi:hypothetical protein